MSCKHCNGEMKPGKAIANTFTGMPDFPGDARAVTLSPGGPGKLIDCLKCVDCGWSVTGVTQMTTLQERLRNGYQGIALGADDMGWGFDLDTINEAADKIDYLEKKNEILYHEREHARASRDNAVRLLSGIYVLLYPAPTITPDGRTMLFRPKGDFPHELLQTLSDRIRALPDELEKLKEAKV